MLLKKLEEKYFEALEAREDDDNYIKFAIFIGVLICIPIAFILDVILFPLMVICGIIAILKGE